MPTIIDTLLVTLGLDASAYRKQAAETRNDQARVVESSDRMAKRLDGDGKRISQSFRNVRNEVAGLVLAFTGAATITGFARSILDSDAATGRLANNLGIATEQVSAWQGAIRRVGGDAKDADAALQSMAAAFQSYQLTGTTGKDADFQGLGVSLNDLRNPAGALLKIAEASERMGRPEFVARAQRLGLSDATINLLAKGRAGVQGLVDEQAKLGVATDESAKAAQQLQDRLAKLQTLITGAARPELARLVGLLVQMADAAFAAKNPLDGLNASVETLGKNLGFFEALGRILAHIEKGRAALRSGHVAEAWSEFSAAAREPLLPKAGGYISGQPDPDNRTTAQIRAAGFPGYQGRGGGGVNAGIIAYLQRAGFTNEQARGIQAGIGAEGGHATARNPTSGAFGIGQWLGARQQRLFARYGRNPTEQQQLEFLVWELNGGDHGGRSVRSQQTAEGTLNAYIRNFMRPAAGAETIGDLSRGMRILGGRMPVNAARGSSSTSTTTVGQITVYTAATDGKGVARDLGQAIRDRGLVVQSGSGMVP